MTAFSTAVKQASTYDISTQRRRKMGNSRTTEVQEVIMKRIKGNIFINLPFKMFSTRSSVYLDKMQLKNQAL